MLLKVPLIITIFIAGAAFFLGMVWYTSQLQLSRLPEASTAPGSAPLQLSGPQPNSTVSDPIRVSGQARGSWFFEATFPLRLENTQGETLATGYAEAQSDWMTTGFVPFEGELSIPENFSGQAYLFLEKDNPSGLPEHSDSVRIPLTVSPAPDSSLTPSASDSRSVEVFFSNPQLLSASQDDCLTVFPVIRSIPKTTAVARAALEQLLAGTTEQESRQGYVTAINPGVRIQRFVISDGTAAVDFSAEIEQELGGSCRVGTIYQQIVSTLKQFPTVNQVTISVNGQTEGILQP